MEGRPHRAARNALYNERAERTTETRTGLSRAQRVYSISNITHRQCGAVSHELYSMRMLWTAQAYNAELATLRLFYSLYERRSFWLPLSKRSLLDSTLVLRRWLGSRGTASLLNTFSDTIPSLLFHGSSVSWIRLTRAFVFWLYHEKVTNYRGCVNACLLFLLIFRFHPCFFFFFFLQRLLFVLSLLLCV